MVIRNSAVWIKIQASFRLPERPVELFHRKLTLKIGMRLDDYRPDSPFSPSVLADNLANWASVVDQLPAGWDRDEYRMDGEAYPWCETLSDGCDCHGWRGRLDLMYCADFGLHEDRERRANKSQNAHYRFGVASLERAIVETDRRGKTKGTRLPPPPAGAIVILPKTDVDLGGCTCRAFANCSFCG